MVNQAARHWGFRVLPEAAWPAPLTLRWGWAAASARPWNATHDEASLRLRRGGRRFLRACVDHLSELGAPAVFSPPLAPDGLRPWQDAGFATYVELALLRLDLGGPLPPPAHPVRRIIDTAAIVDVDAAAFDDFWALDRDGLTEALDATPRGAILAVGEPVVGFAIVGLGMSTAYLQRVAVHPGHQGRGIGTALITESARLAAGRGRSALFLNTQTDNERSLRLYAGLGFRRLPRGLYLLRA